MADANAARDLSLLGSAERDIETVLAQLDLAEKVIEISRGLTPDLSPAPIVDSVSKTTGANPLLVRRITVALENFRNIKQDVGSSESAFDAIAAALRKQEVAESWQKNKTKIIALFDSYTDENALALSVKAQRLSFLYERLLQDAEIITDARPIYNAKGDNIVEFVITHTFCLTYGSPEGDFQRMHFAMDAADVLKLRNWCDRAISKANTLKSALGQSKTWKVGILRDDGSSS